MDLYLREQLRAIVKRRIPPHEPGWMRTIGSWFSRVFWSPRERCMDLRIRLAACRRRMHEENT